MPLSISTRSGVGGSIRKGNNAEESCCVTVSCLSSGTTPKQTYVTYDNARDIIDLSAHDRVQEDMTLNITNSHADVHCFLTRVLTIH